jgi:hypothetical protein
MEIHRQWEAEGSILKKMSDILEAAGYLSFTTLVLLEAAGKRALLGFG